MLASSKNRSQGRIAFFAFIIATSVVFSCFSAHAQTGLFGKKKKKPKYPQPPASISQPVTSPSGPETPAPQPVQRIAGGIAGGITRLINNGGVLTHIGSQWIEPRTVNKIYSLRANQPVFVSDSGPTPLAEELREILKNQAEAKGLIAEKYWSHDLDDRWAMHDEQSFAELDVLLTASLIRYASDVSIGLVDPQQIDNRYIDSSVIASRPTYSKKQFTQFAYLSTLVSQNYAAGTLAQGLAALEPQHPGYQQLIKAMADLIQLRNAGGYPPVRDSAPRIDPGDPSPAIPGIRKRLIDLGFLAPQLNSTSLIYDADLKSAIMAYQRTIKAQPDGIIGPLIYKSLNAPIETRMAQIRANLEKWRWMPADLGARYITVNIAAQELQVVENGAPLALFCDPAKPDCSAKTDRMIVVNGRQLRPTTLFFAKLNQVILNPYWFPPDNNILQDILPQVRQDLKHFSEQHLSIFRRAKGTPDEVPEVIDGEAMVKVDPATVPWAKYQNVVPPFLFRQDAGDFNSLGNVKFNLDPESHAIYLHDTAHDNEHQTLFQQNPRLFSSGCIRLKEPRTLLYYVLKDALQFTPESLDAMMAQPLIFPAHRIKLKVPIDVYIVYLTSFIDAQGHVNYTPDYYGIDARINDVISPSSRSKGSQP